MLRTALLSVLLPALLFSPSAHAAAAPQAIVTGTVADPTGAIVPGAQVKLTDASGAVVAKTVTDSGGGFKLKAPHQGTYTLTINLAGFKTAIQPVHVGTGAGTPASVTLAVAPAVTEVHVNASTSVDLTSSADNGDTSVMSAKDLKDLPVFDNDYVTAMSAFLDQGDVGTAGSGLMVDGVEVNRAMVSPSAVEEVQINQDPYSAQYYRPGRGQINIITKQSAEKYHGEFNFLFRDSAMNAQQRFAPSKPFEQRRIYEGDLTGPVVHSKDTTFLFSMQRAEEDLQAVVNAVVAPTQANPSGIENVNVPAPTRDTEFSLRIGHQFTPKNSGSIMYAFQNSSNQNEGVGNQTLPEAGYDTSHREDDVVFHDDYIISASKLNQASIVLERTYDPITDANEGPKFNVSGNFVGGSAQADQTRSEYNLRANEIVSWIHGRHSLKFGINLPHLSRRVMDDRTNSDGTYTYSPTYAADGTLLASAIQNYQAANPSGFSIRQGQTRFVYHQQEVGAFIQDQIKISPIFSLTPGLRYDWQTYLGDKTNFSPRLSFALVLNQPSELVLRGGGGIYYDRIGSGPLLDLARYGQAKVRLLQVSSQQQPLCYPITNCATLKNLPPTIVETSQHIPTPYNVYSPSISTPYEIQYGLSLDRKVGENGTISFGGRMNRGVDLFRSIDVNAPVPPFYSARPNSSYSQVRLIQTAGTQNGSALDINYRGRLNKRFTGFLWYTWSHYDNNTSGYSYFPENQYDPNADWGPADWSQRHHFGFYGAFNPEHLLNLGVGLFASTGSPWTITTGADPYGTSLFNARPAGVARNSEIGPDYADLDLRWSYDLKLHPKEMDKSPAIGLSASAFNVVNHPNGSYVDTTEGSQDFAQVTNADPPRRMQLGMRYEF